MTDRLLSLFKILHSFLLSWAPRESGWLLPSATEGKTTKPLDDTAFHIGTGHAVTWLLEELCYKQQWSRVRFPMRSLDFFNYLSFQPHYGPEFREMSTRNLPGGKGRPAYMAGNLTTIRTSAACYLFIVHEQLLVQRVSDTLRFYARRNATE
jgi:hypothetical protein